MFLCWINVLSRTTSGTWNYFTLNLWLLHVVVGENWGSDRSLPGTNACLPSCTGGPALIDESSTHDLCCPAPHRPRSQCLPWWAPLQRKNEVLLLKQITLWVGLPFYCGGASWHGMTPVWNLKPKTYNSHCLTVFFFRMHWSMTQQWRRWF